MKRLALGLLCLTAVASAETPKSLQSAAAEVVALWRGTAKPPSAHIGTGDVRWEAYCFGSKPDSMAAVITRKGSELQHALTDVIVRDVASCDAATGCCRLEVGKRRRDRAYVDAMCFDDKRQLVRVRTTDDDGCHG